MAALAGAATASGCGLGPGEAGKGDAELVVTRGHGAERVLSATVSDPAASETVARFLDREAEIETRYGGNFVNSINGLEGRASGSRREDWFFYVNGYWSPVGPAEARVRPGDRIWWDYRQWSAAYRVPAVVGSYPEPFVNGPEREQLPVQVACRGVAAACSQVRRSLREAGARFAGDGGERLRVLVGRWRALRADRDARLLAEGPDASGVYAQIGPAGAVTTLDDRGQPQDPLGTEVGLVAALRPGEAPPSWVITGSGPAAVRMAAQALDGERLADAYALAITRQADIKLPVRSEP